MTDTAPIRVLAISGSLRAVSSNTALLQAAAAIAAPLAVLTLYRGLADLPPFNPDLDEEGCVAPPAVAELRALVRAADALLISSPEYAHGVPGVLKNALDWLVSDPTFPGKPVGLLNAAPRATHAQASLAETLATMSARLVPGASLALPLSGRGLGPAEIAADAALAGPLRGALEALVAACHARGCPALE